jgi:hypothetical protein
VVSAFIRAADLGDFERRISGVHIPTVRLEVPQGPIS